MVGLLGGVVGLGDAEFRLPLLLSVFGFAALAAVFVNKAMSLVVVLVANPGPADGHPDLRGGRRVAGGGDPAGRSLAGAWLGASQATRIASATLHRVLAVLLVFIAVVFTAERVGSLPQANLNQPVGVDPIS